MFRLDISTRIAKFMGPTWGVGIDVLQHTDVQITFDLVKGPK